MSKALKTIGIVGGQGPVSTADFYMRVVSYYQAHLGAKSISDYPPMIIFSVPTPDLIKGNDGEGVTYTAIADAVKKLEQGGADFIVIVCNSLQYLIPRLQKLVSIQIIGIVPIVANYVQKTNNKTVGVLATDTTLKNKVYSTALEQRGIKVLIPSSTSQIKLEQVITNEVGGIASDEDRKRLLRIIEELKAGGAEAVLLACTELPLLIKQSDTDIALVDCNDLYVCETAIRSADN